MAQSVLINCPTSSGRSSSAAPLARIARFLKDCKQALDAGAGGIIVPMIESAEQLIRVRDACRWPRRKRGVGFSRANLFGKYFETLCGRGAGAVAFVAMIEHAAAGRRSLSHYGGRWAGCDIGRAV